MQPVVAARPLRRIALVLALAATPLTVVTVAHVGDEPATLRRSGLVVGRIPTAALWAPAPWTPQPIALVAIPATTVVAPGQLLDLSVFLANRTNGPILALPTLDASDVGWRFPKIAVEARDVHGRLVSTEDPEKHGRCGNINDLHHTDFKIIPPGESLEVNGAGSFGLDAWAPLAPGRYSIRVRYDLSFVGNDGAMYDEYSHAILDAGVLPYNIYFSNPITIDVTAAPPP